MASKYTHEHKYYLAKIGKTWQVYKCALPGCPHYLPHVKLMHNRRSVCWGCGDIFILSHAKHRRVVRPKCENCVRGLREGKSRVDRDTIQELVDKLGDL